MKADDFTVAKVFEAQHGKYDINDEKYRKSQVILMYRGFN